MENENKFLDPMGDRQVAHWRQPLALILADDPCTTLDKLTSRRCKPALPFAGKYRTVDFALSNCVNSGIETVGVITQYRPRSLHAHLAFGRPWGLDRRGSGLTLLHPYQAHTGIGWYAGTADALLLNQDFILHYQRSEVLVLLGCQVYTMDFGPLIARHRETKADLTLAAVPVRATAAEQCHTLAVDDEGWVCDWVPPGHDAPGGLAAMGVLLFSTDALSWRLSEDAQQPASTHDLIRDLILRMIEAGDRVMAFRHAGFWSDLQTVCDYWNANLDLLREDTGLSLQGTSWPIRTQSQVRPPTHIASGASVSRSLISEGCVVEGTVERSILSPGVHVAPGAVVRSSVVMHDTVIEEGALVENAILDSDVVVGPGARVGKVDHYSRTRSAFQPERLVIVEQGVHVPARAVVEPDALLADWLLPVERRDLSEAQVSVAC